MRARFFADALAGLADTRVEYRATGRSGTVRQFLQAVRDYRPSLLYVLDGFAASATALYGRYISRIPYIIDCAATYEDYLRLVESSAVNCRAGRLIDHILLGRAAAVACRGLIQKIVFESRYYNRTIAHLSEGVDLERWMPKDGTALRSRYGLGDSLVVGVIGSIEWSERFQWAYGREIIEALRILHDKPVCGVLLPSVMSDRHTLERLERMAHDYGVEQRLRIIPNIPREEVPDYLSMMDVCVSTQLPSVVGEMRTTAKLTDYLACGKFVLATKVGDARFYLPEAMLVDYVNADDYYHQLAQRLAQLCEDRSMLVMGQQTIAVAQQYFDYRKIALRARELIASVLGLQEQTRAYALNGTP